MSYDEVTLTERQQQQQQLQQQPNHQPPVYDTLPKFELGWKKCVRYFRYADGTVNPLQIQVEDGERKYRDIKGQCEMTAPEQYMRKLESDFDRPQCVVKATGTLTMPDERVREFEGDMRFVKPKQTIKRKKSTDQSKSSSHNRGVAASEREAARNQQTIPHQYSDVTNRSTDFSSAANRTSGQGLGGSGSSSYGQSGMQRQRASTSNRASSHDQNGSLISVPLTSNIPLTNRASSAYQGRITSRNGYDAKRNSGKEQRNGSSSNRAANYGQNKARSSQNRSSQGSDSSLVSDGIDRSYMTSQNPEQTRLKTRRTTEINMGVNRDHNTRWTSDYQWDPSPPGRREPEDHVLYLHPGDTARVKLCE